MNEQLPDICAVHVIVCLYCRLGENHGFYTVVAQFRDGSSENVARKPDIDKILASHIEKKKAERVKFRLATTTRSNQKDPNSRCSPPMYNYEPSPPNYYNQSNGWDGHMPGGYQGNDCYQGTDCYQGPEGYYGNNSWGNWGAQNSQSLSPNGNSAKSKNPGSKQHHRNQGPSHQAATFSNHPSDKLRWGKAGTIAKA
jgi:hypothetical protein